QLAFGEVAGGAKDYHGARVRRPDVMRSRRAGSHRTARSTAEHRLARAAVGSAPRWTRRVRRPRSASTARSPRAAAAFATPKVKRWPGTGRSCVSLMVICRKTPVFGPPLYAWPVEC